MYDQYWPMPFLIILGAFATHWKLSALNSVWKYESLNYLKIRQIWSLPSSASNQGDLASRFQWFWCTPLKRRLHPQVGAVRCIIYTPNLGVPITVFNQEREQGCFRGSSEGRSKGAPKEHRSGGKVRYVRAKQWKIDMPVTPSPHFTYYITTTYWI